MSSVVSGADRDALADVIYRAHVKDWGPVHETLPEYREADAVIAAGWLPPTEPTAVVEALDEFGLPEPTAEHAGDTDDAGQVAAETLLAESRCMDVHAWDGVAEVCAACRSWAVYVNARLAALSAAVPDTDDATVLRTAIEALRLEWHEAAQATTNTDQASLARRAVYLRAKDDLRAVLGDPAGTLAEHNAKVRAEALREAKADIKARIAAFSRLDAHSEYMAALNDAWGLVANRERDADRLAVDAGGPT